MTEHEMPIEVRLILRDNTSLDTKALLTLLQDIADQWYWQQFPTIPCGYVSKNPIR